MLRMFNTLFGDPNKKVIAELQKDVQKINAFEDAVKQLSDDALKGKTSDFRARLASGTKLDDMVFEAFAVAREAARRTLNQRHFDVQLMGGLVLHRHGIAEMRTGEGKTLTATTALYANALEGKGCHLVTVNDYLAKRDAVWMGQIFHALGLKVGVITHESGYLYDPAYKHDQAVAAGHDQQRDETGAFKVHMDFLRPVHRREAYQADITYGTNNEFGFDFLRDNMVPSTEQCVMRGLHFAIVDEVDSILIDEARTPLIISAPARQSQNTYNTFAVVMRSLQENVHYNVDEKMRTATFTDAGITKVEEILKINNLYDAGNGLQYYADAALRAHALFKKDVQYVVRDGQVVIVDEFTGRLMPGRRYSEGLHQAIEAKEGVEVQRESLTLATITFQNYFRMYTKLAGMTGTAATEAEEFSKIYNLEVTTIPTNRPISRKDLPDRIYKSEMGKFQAVVKEIKERHEKGQPVLVGTVSIEKNELLGALLTREGIPFQLLNAKNHEKEGEIIAQAGKFGGVTIATNMAGRGVDIMLGGNPTTPEEAQRVRDVGGLHVIGTERHESRRIDNQLRGRAARQGDPGSTQFCLSMEDDLMRIFGSDRMRGLMDRLQMPEDMPIENRLLTRQIEGAQHRVEGFHFDTRKHLLEYDDVLNKHREVMYKRRKEVMLAYDDTSKPTILREKLLELIEEEIEQVVLFHTGETPEGQTGHDWNPKEILEVAATLVPFTDDERQTLQTYLTQTINNKQQLAKERTTLIERIMQAAQNAYDRVEKAFPNRQQLRALERAVILGAIDTLWIDHLSAITALRTGIGLQGYAQRDPLVEYKKQAYEMFQRLLTSINQEIAYSFFKHAKHAADIHTAAKQQSVGQELMASALPQAENPKLQTSSAAPNVAPIRRSEVGSPTPTVAPRPNELCHCGSGKKFKKCHGA